MKTMLKNMKCWPLRKYIQSGLCCFQFEGETSSSRVFRCSSEVIFSTLAAEHRGIFCDPSHSSECLWTFAFSKPCSGTKLWKQPWHHSSECWSLKEEEKLLWMGDNPPWTTSRGSGFSTTSQNLTELKNLGRKNGGESLKGEPKDTWLLQKLLQATATGGAVV